MFYGYENHPHKRVTIHLADCRECNCGEGTRGTGPTRNGSWTRGFATVVEAKATVAGLEPTARPCKICRNLVGQDLTQYYSRGFTVSCR